MPILAEIDPSSLSKGLQKEWAVIMSAPYLFSAAVIVVGLGIWAFIHFIYKERIKDLNGRISLRDDQLADCKKRQKVRRQQQKTANVAIATTTAVQTKESSSPYLIDALTLLGGRASIKEAFLGLTDHRPFQCRVNPLEYPPTDVLGDKPTSLSDQEKEQIIAIQTLDEMGFIESIQQMANKMWSFQFTQKAAAVRIELDRLPATLTSAFQINLAKDISTKQPNDFIE